MMQKPIKRKDLLDAAINQKISIVEVKLVTLSEGQPVPKHYHPCPVVGYVVSGSVLFQVEGQESKILKAGDAFYEPKDKIILHFDNASKNESLSFVAFYLKEQDEENIVILEK
jgi:quercetin dioxygenase-like cupin family protein